MPYFDENVWSISTYDCTVLRYTVRCEQFVSYLFAVPPTDAHI